MVDFDTLVKKVAAWPGEVLTEAQALYFELQPPPEIRIDRYSETNIGLSTIPEVRPRPKTDLDGAERILKAFDGLPIVPGQVDVAFDPIAKLFGRPVLAFRVNGYVWTGLIESYPSNGSVLGEWLKSAYLNQSGFSRASFSAETILRGLSPEVTEGISNRGPVQNLDLISEDGFRYQILTVPEHARKTWNIDLTLQVMELGQNLLLATPVGGAASGETQARMLNRLPVPMRDAVIRDLLEIPNIPRSVMTYGASYPARIGLLQLQKMPKGFEVPAEPMPRSVAYAGLLGGLLGLLSAGWSRVSSVFSSSGSSVPVRPVRPTTPASGVPPARRPSGTRSAGDVGPTTRPSGPRPVGGVDPVRRPSGTRPAGHPDTSPHQAEPVGHRSSRPNVPVARREPRVTAPGAMQDVAVQLRLAQLEQQVGCPVKIARTLGEIEGALPERGGLFAVVKLLDGTIEVRMSARGEVKGLVLDGEHQQSGGPISSMGGSESVKMMARLGGMKEE